MNAPKGRTGKQAPLLEIRKPLRVRVYRGQFQPFAWTRYLDVTALKAAQNESGLSKVSGKFPSRSAFSRTAVLTDIRWLSILSATLSSIDISFLKFLYSVESTGDAASFTLSVSICRDISALRCTL